MSQISLLHDDIYSELATLFPSKKILTNNLVIEANNHESLENGYAVYLGTALNTRKLVSCQLSINREVTITLTMQIRGSHNSLPKIKEYEKLLLEDQFTLIKRFSKLDELSTAKLNAVNFTNDNGIQRVFSDKRLTIMIETNFEIDYFESLN
jgi:hypothetical protein